MKGKLKSKKVKVLLIVAAILLVIVLLVVKVVSSISNAVSGLNGMVQVATVEQKDLSESITLNGTIQGVSSTNVTSKAAAKFTEVNVSVGDVVNEGDVLASLDASDINTQINDTSKAISNAKALTDLTNQENQEALASAQADQTTALADAKKTWDREAYDYETADAKYQSDLTALNNAKNAKASYDTALKNYNDKDAEYTADSVSLSESQQAELDGLKATSDTAYANYNTKLNGYRSIEEMQAAVDAEYTSLGLQGRRVADAKSAYDSTVTTTNRAIDSAQDVIDASAYQTTDSTASNNLKNLKDQKADCTVKAPCSGVVTSVKVSVGDTNTPGVAFITIQDTSTLVISSLVDEADIMKLSEGMTAKVTTKATGDEEINGTISRITRVKSVAADGTGGYETEITIDNKDLLIGMTAKAKITLREKKNVLAVPYDMIQYDDNGNAFVMAAEDNGDGTGMATAVRKNVTIGEEINYYTEILGGDLKVGDQIFFDSAIEEGASVYPYDQWSDVVEEQ